jgi:hypothetical protein
MRNPFSVLPVDVPLGAKRAGDELLRANRLPAYYARKTGPRTAVRRQNNRKKSAAFSCINRGYVANIHAAVRRGLVKTGRILAV